MPGEDTDATVVVVDDEPALLSLVCEMLEEAGISCIRCAKGTGAYLLIRTHQPKVVILDVQMPKIDGIQVFEQLRGDPATAEIPVIFLTANVHLLYDQLPDFPAMQATVLPKPFNVMTLLAQVRQYLPPV